VYYVYIMADRPNGTLYTGVTSDIAARIAQHRDGTGSAFVWKYGLFKLVWTEPFPTAVEAIANEKRLKRWQRKWKVELIEKANPDWRDLYEDLFR
jgi:putative endonuclease